MTIRSDKKIVKLLAKSVSQLKLSTTPKVKSNRDTNLSIEIMSALTIVTGSTRGK